MIVKLKGIDSIRRMRSWGNVVVLHFGVQSAIINKLSGFSLGKISVAGQTGGSLSLRYNNHLEEKNDCQKQNEIYLSL